MSKRIHVYIEWTVLALGIAGMSAVVADAPLTWAHLRNGLSLTGLAARSPIGTPIPGTVDSSPLQWLLDASTAVSYSLGGTVLLTALCWVLTSAACLAAVARRQHRGLLFTAAAALAVAPALHPFLGAQGSGVSFICGLALFGILDCWDRADSKWIWALPVLFLVWSWCSPLAIPALLFPVLSLLLPRTHPTSRRALLIFLAAVLLSIAATCAPPAGFHGWSGVLFPVANPQGTNIVFGGASPDFHTWELRAVEVITSLFAAALGFRANRTLRITGLFICCIVLVFQAVEFLVLLAAFMIPLYGTVMMDSVQSLSDAFPTLRNLRSRMAHRLATAGTWSVRAAVGLGGLLLVGEMLPVSTAVNADLPLAAIRTANAVLPRGTVLYTPLPWASGAAVSYTKGTVLFTGDATTFTTRELEDYDTIHLVESSWKSTIERLHIGAAIIPIQSQEASLFSLLGWNVVCRNGIQGTELVQAPFAEAGTSTPVKTACQS